MNGIDKYFMGWPIPDEIKIEGQPLTGGFILTEGEHVLSGLSAMEVRSRIIGYWKMKGVEVEQYRSPNQTPRSAATAQHTSGNSGGTQQAIAAPSGAPLTKGVPIYSGQRAGSITLATTASPYFGSGVIGGPIRPPRTLTRAAAPVVGELIGHRAWTAYGGKLHSTAMNTEWIPGEPMTDKSGHGSSKGPGIEDYNNLGVWAFNNPYYLSQEFWPILNGRHGPNLKAVFGTIWMWGTVIEHERGYRAQYASIRSLDLGSPGLSLEALRMRYLKENPCPLPPQWKNG